MTDQKNPVEIMIRYIIRQEEDKRNLRNTVNGLEREIRRLNMIITENEMKEKAPGAGLITNITKEEAEDMINKRLDSTEITRMKGEDLDLVDG